jgi:hypothetical protein
MVKDFTYQDINQVLKKIELQIIDSLQFASEFVPKCSDPKELYYILDSNLTYISDPPGIELLQSFQTLIDNNYHGIPGGGDCDCFVIACTSAMICQGWKNIYIVLAGNTTEAPSHIYNAIGWKNQKIILDLTENIYNSERKYKYYQFLKIN